jgi:hypothetical protein
MFYLMMALGSAFVGVLPLIFRRNSVYFIRSLTWK